MAAVTDLGFATYARLAELPLRIDGYSTERRELDVSSGFLRVTTTVVLRGGGFEGRGEDVTYAAEDHDGSRWPCRSTGDWTLDGFSRLIGGLDLFPAGPPQQEFFRPYRRWAFESAALDLALRQRGQSLGAALGRPYRPVRFVLSTRLDVRPWLKVDPELEFKLDPTPEWDAVLAERVAASGRVRVLDFKAFYEGSVVENPPDPVQYAHGREGVPGRGPRGPGARGAGARRAATVARAASASTRRSTPGRTSRRSPSGCSAPTGPRSATSTSSRRASVRVARAALLRRARPGRRHGAVRRRPVRARRRPRPDRGARQPLLRRTGPTTSRRASTTARPRPACRAARWSRSSRTPDSASPSGADPRYPQAGPSAWRSPYG